ncbi:MAG: hypothetical protein RBU37_05115 [Myxococcota bacterium]|nr:hypothetical protein [Myxococcota bacterium]
MRLFRRWYSGAAKPQTPKYDDGGPGQAPNRQEMGGPGQARHRQELGDQPKCPINKKWGPGQAPHRQEMGAPGQARNRQERGTGQVPNQQEITSRAAKGLT